MKSSLQINDVKVEAKVIRKNGEVEDLGVINKKQSKFAKIIKKLKGV